MNILHVLLTITLCFFSINASLQHSDNNGLIKGIVDDVMKLLNVDLNLYRGQDQSLALNHITHAYNFLKQYSQADRDFYRKGGKPALTITLEQAQKIIRLTRGTNALLPLHTPSTKKTADVVIFSGMPWSLEKRLHSFKKFLEDGFTCNNVYFLSISRALDAHAKEVASQHAELFTNITTHFIQADANHSVEGHKNFMKKIKPTISQEFYLVSDPEYADDLHASCVFCGQAEGLTCLGTYMRPITTDPNTYTELDLKGYGFDEFINDPNEQKIAAGYASLHLLAYQLAQEIQLIEISRN